MGKIIDTIKVKDKDKPKRRSGPEINTLQHRPGAGPMKNRDRDVARGRSRKPKHKDRDMDQHMAERVASRFLKNSEE